MFPDLRLTVLLAGLMASSIYAAVSLIVFALLARAFFANEARVFSMGLIAAGSLVTTCVGSWLSQPAVTRLVTRHLGSH
ncbi:hypothetical protein [Actinoplanes sp. NPDC023714]|uniref:hypothetical protein n=1 Tax=Actinoplanes sp. NPDC023714 TaxID=3154322 RepID=UPI0033D430F2